MRVAYSCEKEKKKDLALKDCAYLNIINCINSLRHHLLLFPFLFFFLFFWEKKLFPNEQTMIVANLNACEFLYFPQIFCFITHSTY